MCNEPQHAIVSDTWILFRISPCEFRIYSSRGRDETFQEAQNASSLAARVIRRAVSSRTELVDQRLEVLRSKSANQCLGRRDVSISDPRRRRCCLTRREPVLCGTAGTAVPFIADFFPDIFRSMSVL